LLPIIKGDAIPGSGLNVYPAKKKFPGVPIAVRQIIQQILETGMGGTLATNGLLKGSRPSVKPAGTSKRLSRPA